MKSLVDGTGCKNDVNLQIGFTVLNMSSSANIFWFGQPKYNHQNVGNVTITAKFRDSKKIIFVS